MTALDQLREELSDPNAGPLFKYVSAIRAYRHALRALPSAKDTTQNKYDALVLLSTASDSYLTHMNKVAATTPNVLPGLTEETVNLIDLVLQHPNKDQIISGALSGKGEVDQNLLGLITDSMSEYTYRSEP